jgi:opacity protein-like surface antigen
LVSVNAFAQLEASFGYSHLSGNFGLDGFNAGLGYHFNPHVTLVGESEFVWDNSQVGVFDLSPTLASLRIKSNEQNYLGGARFRIIGWKATHALEKRKLLPYAEVLMGVSRLNQKVTNIQTGTITTANLDATDQAFTWVIGGGTDYTISHNWLARGSIDFVRTHFVDSGQSRVRIHLGLAYVF